MGRIEDILRGYLRFVRPAGADNVAGPCPFHKSGQEKRPSFYMSTTKGVFFCHACGAKGTLPQFLRAMGASRTEVDLTMAGIEFEPKEVTARKRQKSIEARLNEAILGLFDFCPTDLVKAGFSKKLLKEHEVGFDKSNMRIIFPLRDTRGTLVALIGRTVVDGYPRYKCYDSNDLMAFANKDPDLEALYKGYKVNHRAFLWNMHRVYPEAFFGKLKEVNVVEGYKACLWMIQQGWPNTVAIQGSQSTFEQERVLASLGATINLFLDANFAGRIGTLKSGGRLVDEWGVSVRVCEYPDTENDNAQPDNLDREEIKGVLDAGTNFRVWRMRWTDQNADLLSHNAPRTTWRSGRASRE